jgi:hypothetical protein
LPLGPRGFRGLFDTAGIKFTEITSVRKFVGSAMFDRDGNKPPVVVRGAGAHLPALYRWMVPG